MPMPPPLRGVLAACLLAAALPAAAAVFRIASGFDPQSMDPHALALQYQTRVIFQVYDNLVNRSRDFRRLEPSLATSWEMVDATTWRFHLRPRVKFHDGSDFTADDAVFSIARALEKTSQRANQMHGITGARKVDPLTIEVLSSTPDAVLPEKLWQVAMVSKAWCEQHGVGHPQDYDKRQETYAVRHANGTGPFMLERYDADSRTVLKAFPGWWGKGTDAAGGNLDEVEYLVIQNDASRLAALQSGQVDFVFDPPFQDVVRLKAEPSLKVVSTEDIGTQYLAFDQAHDELPDSGVKGNPFKDLRVRKAIDLALDMDLIVKQVLRGEATATGSVLSPLVDGSVPALQARAKSDPAAARALLRQAGYGEGFAVTLDCVNAAYRQAVCQSVAAMLGRIGIKVKFQAWPSSQFFPKLTQGTASFMEFGWSPSTDPWVTMQSIVHTHEASAGTFNGGRYSSAKLDALIDGIRVEPDIAQRRKLVAQALQFMHDELPVIPMYRRHHNWAMKPGITVVQWPNDTMELRWVHVSPGR